MLSPVEWHQKISADSKDYGVCINLILNKMDPELAASERKMCAVETHIQG